MKIDVIASALLYTDEYYDVAIYVNGKIIYAEVCVSGKMVADVKQKNPDKWNELTSEEKFHTLREIEKEFDYA